MSNELQQLFREAVVQARLDSELTGVTGRYKGDPTPTINLPDGMIWWRKDGADIFESAYNLNVRTDQSDVPVTLEPSRDGKPQVRGVDPIAGPEALGAAATDYNHGDLHGSELATDLPNRLLTELRLRLSEDGDLNVVLEAGVYEDASGDLHAVDEQTLDLTPYVTATGGKKAPVIIGLDSGDLLTAYTGADVDATADPTASPYFDLSTFITTRNAATGAVIWLWGIGLTHGQTSLTNTAEFVHLRPYLNVGVSGPGSSTDRAIATWNGTDGTTLRDNPNASVTPGGGLKAATLQINAPALAASALVEFDSTTKGLLIPAMTTTQRNVIGSPADGLLVYDTTLHQLFQYQAGAWVAFGVSGAGSLAVSDGTTTVAAVASLTLVGAAVTGTTPNAVATISASAHAKLYIATIAR